MWSDQDLINFARYAKSYSSPSTPEAALIKWKSKKNMETTPMTHDEKINYMRMACNICSFNLKAEHMDLLVTTYEAVMQKGGEFTVKDAVAIEREVAQRHIKVKAEASIHKDDED